MHRLLFDPFANEHKSLIALQVFRMAYVLWLWKQALNWPAALVQASTNKPNTISRLNVQLRTIAQMKILSHTMKPPNVAIQFKFKSNYWLLLQSWNNITQMIYCRPSSINNCWKANALKHGTEEHSESAVCLKSILWININIIGYEKLEHFMLIVHCLAFQRVCDRTNLCAFSIIPTCKFIKHWQIPHNIISWYIRVHLSEWISAEQCIRGNDREFGTNNDLLWLPVTLSYLRMFFDAMSLHSSSERVIDNTHRIWCLHLC